MGRQQSERKHGNGCVKVRYLFTSANAPRGTGVSGSETRHSTQKDVDRRHREWTTEKIAPASAARRGTRRAVVWANAPEEATEAIHVSRGRRVVRIVG